MYNIHVKNMLTNLELANHFGWKTINGDYLSLTRPVEVAQLDRPGLELLGLMKFHNKKRIMLLGNKEIALIKDNDPDFIYRNCLEIFSKQCPAIIITHSAACPDCVLKAAKETNAPIFSSPDDTSDLSSSLYIYLSEALAPKTSIHACLLEIYGLGVALMGESGIGKSEVALDLIKKGHRLIADDRVDVTNVRGKLIGTCPESIYGMMEVRGIGIINIQKMFGVNALDKKSKLNLIIKLVNFDASTPLERIGMKTEHYSLLGESVPLINIPVSAARSLAALIETAVTNFKLKEDGYDTGYEFTKRLQEIQERHREEKARIKSIEMENKEKK